MDILAYILLSKIFSVADYEKRYYELLDFDDNTISGMDEDTLNDLAFWWERIPHTHKVKVNRQLFEDDARVISALDQTKIDSLDYKLIDVEDSPSNVPLLALLGVFSPISV